MPSVTEEYEQVKGEHVQQREWCVHRLEESIGRIAHERGNRAQVGEYEREERSNAERQDDELDVVRYDDGPNPLRARLGFSIPASLSGPRGITPAFG